MGCGVSVGLDVWVFKQTRWFVLFQFPGWLGCFSGVSACRVSVDWVNQGFLWTEWFGCVNELAL